jgi:flagellar assembly factor FliW
MTGDDRMQGIELTHPLAAGATVTPEEIWTFPEGLLGVPDLHRFALIPLADAEPFQLLCSAEGAGFGIVLVDPAALVPDYSLELAPADLRPLAVTDAAQLRIRVAVRLPGGEEALSLNLKGPIVLSPGERLGVQRISPDEAHAVRFVPSLLGTGSGSCSS